MNSGVVQLLVLAGIAVFLILKLRNVLGTRDGFERPALRDAPPKAPAAAGRQGFSVVEGGLDRDIVDNVPAGSPSADALARMKGAEPAFSMGEFLRGAKGAYEMVVMAFQHGDLSSVQGFIAPEVLGALQGVIDERKAQGLTVEATFNGLREMHVENVAFDQASREAEISLRFLADLTTTVRKANGEIVDGGKEEIRQQRDVWTFARVMGSADPNWHLVATSQ